MLLILCSLLLRVRFLAAALAAALAVARVAALFLHHFPNPP